MEGGGGGVAGERDCGSMDCDLPFASIGMSFDCHMDSMSSMPSMGSMSELPSMDSMCAGGLAKALPLAQASAIEPGSGEWLQAAKAPHAQAPPPVVGCEPTGPAQQQRLGAFQAPHTTAAPVFGSPQRRLPTHPPDEFNSPPPQTAPIPPLAGSTPVAAAVPTTSAFLQHCQVTPPTYPQIPRQQLTVPTGPQSKHTNNSPSCL